MIRVVVSASAKEITKITILGHADYDCYGKDIVCSSVSSIVTTTINGILMFDRDNLSYDEQKDHFEIIINKHNNIVDNLVTNMINLLKELEQDYPKNIKIEEED